MGDVFGQLVLDMGTKTAIVLLLLYGSLMLLRRFSGLQQPRRRGGRVELLSTVVLGPGRSVHLIQAGGKTLLVGATGQHVSLLTEIDSAAMEMTADPVVATPWVELVPMSAMEYVKNLAGALPGRGKPEKESGPRRKSTR